MMTTRPPELELVGATIKTNYGTGGQVLAVTGPYPPDPNACPRPWLGGWTIVYASPLDGGKCWINEVHVVDGRIYAHPWRDEIEVVETTGVWQTRLF